MLDIYVWNGIVCTIFRIAYILDKRGLVALDVVFILSTLFLI